MRLVNLISPGWTGATVGVAETFRDRLRGIRSPKVRDGVMLRMKSVHTMGMDTPIDVLAIDRQGTVTAVRRLVPNRVAFFREAEHLVEFPAGRILPVVGSVVVFDE